jgi:hypothetical protein
MSQSTSQSTLKYEEAFWQEMTAGSDKYFGVKILIAMPRELTEKDKSVLRKHSEAIEEEFAALTALADPELEKKKFEEKMAILRLFPEELQMYVEEIPNGYCSRPCCYHKPWFIVTTPQKGRITIGWRKSVIAIDWKDSAIKEKAEVIFPKEEVYPGCAVTKVDWMIHAHGEEKAREYIKVLLERP